MTIKYDPSKPVSIINHPNIDVFENEIDRIIGNYDETMISVSITVNVDFALAAVVVPAHSKKKDLFDIIAIRFEGGVETMSVRHCDLFMTDALRGVAQIYLNATQEPPCVHQLI